MNRIALALVALGSIGAAPAPLVVAVNTGDPARQIVARAQLDVGDIRLSGEAKLLLTVEGAGPLEVTPGKPLLPKANTWRAREDGLPLREKLDNGREKWTQTYRLSPLVPGEVKIGLAALTVRSGGERDTTLTFPGELPVRVTTNIESASIESLRPVTDIESLPAPPSVDDGGRSWRFAIVPLLLALAGLGVYLGRRKREPTTPRDAAWALNELASADLTVDRCAIVLRLFLAFRFGVPAETRTTPELAVRLKAEVRFPKDAIADWEGLLAECDVARFSGTSAAVSGLADRAKGLVANLSENTPEKSTRVACEN